MPSSSQTTQSQWLVHATQWRASGLTRTAYCEQQGLKLHTFIYWLKRCKEQTESAGALTLVPAKISAAPQKPAADLVLECGNGSKLHIPAATSSAWLAALLIALS